MALAVTKLCATPYMLRLQFYDNAAPAGDMPATDLLTYCVAGPLKTFFASVVSAASWGGMTALPSYNAGNPWNSPQLATTVQSAIIDDVPNSICFYNSGGSGTIANQVRVNGSSGRVAAIVDFRYTPTSDH